jgi:aromatic ring-cleaving dioxygenase
MDLQKDDSGQFLLLSGVIISLGLVILLIFVNQSSMGGYSSADSILSFPKNDIRDIRAETVYEAQAIGAGENLNQYLVGYDNTTRGPQRKAMYEQSFKWYADNVTRLMAEKGTVVNLNSTAGLDGQRISNATIRIYYNNGETKYSEDFVTYFG